MFQVNSVSKTFKYQSISKSPRPSAEIYFFTPAPCFSDLKVPKIAQQSHKTLGEGILYSVS